MKKAGITILIVLLSTLALFQVGNRHTWGVNFAFGFGYSNEISTAESSIKADEESLAESQRNLERIRASDPAEAAIIEQRIKNDSAAIEQEKTRINALKAEERRKDEAPKGFEELDAKVTKLKEQKTLLLENIASQQKTLEDKEREFAKKKAAGEDTTSLSNDINGLKSNIAAARKAVNTTNKDLSKFESEFEKTPERRIEKIAKVTRDIVAEIEKKGREIADKLAKCEAEIAVGRCTEEEKAILEDQQKANAAYKIFKNTGGAYDMCVIDEKICSAVMDEMGIMEASKEELKELKDLKAAEVTELLRKLTAKEIAMNKVMTFDVSDVFYLQGQTPGVKLGIRYVADRIADWMIVLVSSLAVTTLIIGGFIMIISAGDETRLEMGKTIFTYSLIGIVVTLMSYGIITFVQSLFY